MEVRQCSGTHEDVYGTRVGLGSPKFVQVCVLLESLRDAGIREDVYGTRVGLGSPKFVHSPNIGQSLARDFCIDKRWLIDPKLLFVGPRIGEGGHGKVYEGKMEHMGIFLDDACKYGRMTVARSYSAESARFTPAQIASRPISRRVPCAKALLSVVDIHEGLCKKTLSGVSSYPAARVRIGALVDANSTLGKEVSKALHLALLNVNQAHDMFNGTKFELEIADCACDPIQGAASVVELMKKEVVLILGPQSSVIAHFIAHIGKAAKVPILSFGATDPNLAEQQYSYFFRISPSDVMQMEAVATLIANFEWKAVVLIYTDDDYGANGASALRQSLQVRGSNLIAVSKIPLDSSPAEMRAELTNLDATQSRVFVLHTQRKLGFRILSQAKDLRMLTSGYVWIVTDLVAGGLLMPDPDIRDAQSFRGLLGTRRFIPQSPLYRDLLTQWREEYPGDMQTLVSNQLNTYGLCAYDALYTAAHAISSHLGRGHNLSFTEFYKMRQGFVGKSDFQGMKILKSGPALRESLQATSFLGASGLIQFDDERDIKNAGFEYINLAGRNLAVVGYWAHGNRISTSAPLLLGNSSANTNLTGVNATSLNITWPGGSTEVPRGWVPPKNGEPLKIGVPKKAGFNELVSQTTDSSNVTRFNGFCIAVFETAVKKLKYAVTYEFVSLASKIVGKTNPVYDDLIHKMVIGELDAAVGDITVTAERLSLVDFTQPYIEAGLVVLVRKKNRQHGDSWAFLRPFSTTMWFTLLGFTMSIGFVIWILERQENQHFQGPAKKQVGVVVWFMFSTLFTAHREETKSFLARIVLILWLFVVLIVTSSYTASLTAILTVEQLTPEIQGLDSLLRSNVPIGFQTGSFAEKYLTGLGISPGRLKDFDSLESYKVALDLGPHKGGVAAIVDELPYIELFLAADCKHYAIAGQVFTKSGWGFAFPRGSGIAEDLSSEILRMSETGQLSSLHDYWFKERPCSEAEASVQEQPNQLGLGVVCQQAK
ncbi:hypothetical protein GOP47_0001420 [Adiantum capillus-veneris]|uniref:Ionotropic glutamate receptor C-terminal domain-containing protein n=1 Tax=Adiantum capillus-veneris TaxID=13818 RepID=A0A9D4V8U5_ADICA|nr:hypothetical protein GOP47_0001420 [Adiantum capillus-veneris]